MTAAFYHDVTDDGRPVIRAHESDEAVILAETADLLTIIAAMDEAERAFDAIARVRLADVRAAIAAAEAAQ